MSERPMTAIAEYQVQTAEEWLQQWAKRADDVRANEPETLAYEAAISVEDESNILIFGRYRHGQSSLNAHTEHHAHPALTQSRVMDASFVDLPDYGWWKREDRQRGEDGRTSGGTALVIAVWRVEEEAMREPFLELSTSHVEYCRENEPFMLTYSGGIATRDFDGVDIVKDDLVFVIECEDMQALDDHVNNPRHVAMGERMAAAGIRVAPSFRKVYRTAGLGFMSRQDV